MRSIEEIIEYIKAKSEPWEIYIPDFVDAEKLLEFIGTKPPYEHVNPISGNRWDKVFVPDCKINFCPNCGVKLEEA